MLIKINLFDGLTDAELRMVIERCARAQRYSAKQVIFQEGASGSEVYCLPKGQVRVELDMGNLVAPRTLATVTGPDIFGEVAFLDGSARSATTIAQEELTLYVLEKEKLLALMNEMPILGFRIMGNFSSLLAKRIRRSNQTLINEVRKLQNVQASAMPLAARKYNEVSHGYTTQVWV
ncbi:MAG: cyclic nucleotide-binding domain-containing protein [Magnetococcales bacterium]|nr:cyclic nucleotide-binding domain-containing protein [Magnetococcales bacterium]